MIYSEKIVETKMCGECNQRFDVTDKDLEFYDDISPIINGKQYSIDGSSSCPKCREQRRLSWRNERKLYRRKCDITGKDIISMFSSDKKNKVYQYNEWGKDFWNPLNYGFEYNADKGFFEQYKVLLDSVPMKSLFIGLSENCDYNNLLTHCKDCYMCFDSQKLENTLFSEYSINVNDSMEVTWSDDIKKSYEILDSVNIYSSSFCNSSSNLVNCHFCYSCENCTDCFMCSGVNNKKYHILNKEYSEKEYKEKVNDVKGRGDYIEFCKNTFNNFNLTIPKKNFKASGNENSVGNNIFNSKDLYKCFNVVSANNFRYVDGGGRSKDVLDGNIIYDGEGKIYNSLSVIGSFSVYNSLYVYNSSDIFYSFYLFGCKNCFGCVGLTNKSYCLFNKQYSKQEYFDLLSRIIKKMQSSLEWGDFFPKDFSLFGYNETIANEFYPLDKEMAIIKGYNWCDYESPFPKVEKIIPAGKLPNDIKDIPDDILNWAIKCDVTEKPFRIIKAELDFYRKYNLPIPKKHPDQRHLDRLNLRGGKKTFDRKCDKCNKQIQSIYSNDKKEIVYCEECFNKEFY
ncbi:MAG: hypothetical protein QM490_04865 [Candidatus Gracilibacteria bacterium]